MDKTAIKRLVFVCVAVVLAVAGFVAQSHPVQAVEQTTNPILSKEIDDFFLAGAKGYLVWQYSGNKGTGEVFASDPYAFFQGTPEGDQICATLKEKASKYPGNFLGVNMWDAGGDGHSGDMIRKHFQWLNQQCGVTVVRIFAKAGGPSGVRKVLDAANGTGVKILVAIGDYSNGSPGLASGVDKTWFESGYKGEYYGIAQQIAGLKGHSSWWGVEFANEVHCRGDDSALQAYTDWGDAIGKLFGGNVGYGQKSSENTTRCDSPGPEATTGTHFIKSNSIGSVTMTSAHYYNDAEKALALEALKQSKSINKMFYIGEAPPLINQKTPRSPGGIFPAVEPKREPFYIQPIKGLEITNTTISPSITNPGGIVYRKKDVIRDDLIKQGYEARCAAPSFNIQLEQAGVEWMEKYLACKQAGVDCNDRATVEGNTDDGKGDGAVFGGKSIDQKTEDIKPPTPLGQRVISVLSIDYRDALIPVFRDFDQTPQLKRSLEDYFGYGETENNTDSYNFTELNSAAINSLLSTPQRCEQSAVSLLAREKMCDKLADPNACALYAAEIPATNFTVKTLLAEFKKMATISTDTRIDYTTEGNRMLIRNTCNLILKDEKSEIRKGMLNLPLNIQDSYRLAFLVTTISTKVPFSGHMMNLFQHPHRGELNEAPDPGHVVIVTAFKVPDILTNKGTITGMGESGDVDFNDPAELTRDVLIPHADKVKTDELGSADRKELLEVGHEIQYKDQNDPRMPIQCRIKGIGGPQCKDATTAALVDLINAEAILNQQKAALSEEQKKTLTPAQLDQLTKLDCNQPSEESSFIFDSADLHSLTNTGRIFKTNWGVAILENIFSDGSHYRLEDLASFSSNKKEPAYNKEFDPTYADTESNKINAPGGEHWGLKSVFHVVQDNKGSDGEGRIVSNYIVYPTGYDEKTVEAVLSGSFFTSAQITALKEKALEYQNLELKNDKQLFEGGQISSGEILDKTHKDSEGFWCGEFKRYDALTGQAIYADPCPVGSFSFALDLDKPVESARILGARLGYWLHTIQQSLQKATALTHKYLENCASTEEFLLDSCGGATTAEVSTGADQDKDFEKVGSFSITYWNGSEVVFQPPSQELWDAINSASQQHGCDPWLVLATAHGESPTFENASIPNANGEQGVFQFTPLSWEKWKTENGSGKNANHRLSSCDFWQPTSFSAQGQDFSSPTNLRAAADSACRKVLWTGMQGNSPDEKKTTLSGFIQHFSGQGASPDHEVWSSGQVSQAEYVYRLWGELLKRSGSTPRAQTPAYPYANCMGTAPTPNPASMADYTGKTTLPAAGQATYYSAGVMNTTLNTRIGFNQLSRAFLNSCEIATTDSSIAQQFSELQATAERNGTGKFVGCAALLRLGDIPFYTSHKTNDIRTIWIKRPPGAPSDIPAAIGPIAVIDVAAKGDYPRLKSKGWVVDLDYNTFKRLFSWQGGWQRPQEGIRICETAAECQ